MDPITPPSSSIQPIRQTSTQPRERGQGQPTTVGQLIKATVVESSGNNRFVLDFSGSRQPVRSEAALSVGQKLQLQVMTTSPAIELKIVTDTLNAFLGRSLTLLNSSIDLATLLKGLGQHADLATLSSASRTMLTTFLSMQQQDAGGKDGGLSLKFLVENLGLNLENLLARGDSKTALNTLKAALLEVAGSFRGAESIADVTTRILTTIELFQFAQLNSSADALSIFPLPLPFLDLGYLSVERRDQGKKGGSDPEEHRFALHLRLSDIGNLRIDFIKSVEGLIIKFQAETEEIAGFIKTASEELEKTISGEGRVTMSFFGGAPDPRLDLIHYLVPEGRSILDTTI